MVCQVCNCWCPSYTSGVPFTRIRPQYKCAGTERVEENKTHTEQEIPEEIGTAISGEEDFKDFEEDIAIREINKVLGGDEDADSDYELDFEDEVENEKSIGTFNRELQHLISKGLLILVQSWGKTRKYCCDSVLFLG